MRMRGSYSLAADPNYRFIRRCWFAVFAMNLLLLAGAVVRFVAGGA